MVEPNILSFPPLAAMPPALAQQFLPIIDLVKRVWVRRKGTWLMWDEELGKDPDTRFLNTLTTGIGFMEHVAILVSQPATLTVNGLAYVSNGGRWIDIPFWPASSEWVKKPHTGWSNSRRFPVSLVSKAIAALWPSWAFDRAVRNAVKVITKATQAVERVAKAGHEQNERATRKAIAKALKLHHEAQEAVKALRLAERALEESLRRKEAPHGPAK